MIWNYKKNESQCITGYRPSPRFENNESRLFGILLGRVDECTQLDRRWVEWLVGVRGISTSIHAYWRLEWGRERERERESEREREIESEIERVLNFFRLTLLTNNMTCVISTHLLLLPLLLLIGWLHATPNGELPSRVKKPMLLLPAGT